MTGSYLSMQIGAGVHGVQVFESMADLFTAEEYAEFAQPYQTRVFAKIPATCPRLLFAKEIDDIEGMASTGADVLSVGGCVDLHDARARLGKRVAFQGNVDNQILLQGSEADVEAATAACIDAGGRHGHIVNLNHGILKGTPFENVVRMIETVRKTSDKVNVAVDPDPLETIMHESSNDATPA